MGMLKQRLTPEHVTINIGDKEKAPPAPDGHKWKVRIAFCTYLGILLHVPRYLRRCLGGWVTSVALNSRLAGSVHLSGHLATGVGVCVGIVGVAPDSCG
jgi:hypothetical protein